MIHSSRTTSPYGASVPVLLTVFIAISLALIVALPLHAGARPDRATLHASAAQNVDWMSSETASRLDIGMDVLVPSWVPAPFSGIEPSVSASAGYYQLYWMVGGSAPTFLYIEGVAGGAMPAGSPADLNKQLTVNASVQGWSAIHDLGIPAGSDTPIYDQVWWIQNGVLYTVSSNNMTGSDSLSLANSLVVLQPPAAPAPPPVEAPPVEEPVEQAPNEPVGETWEEPAPPVEDAPVDEPVTSTGSEPRSVDTGTVNEPSGGSTSSSTTAAGTVDENPDGEAPGQTTTGGPWTPGRGEANVPSDGTNGAPPPVIGGDGTGGWYDTALPANGPVR